VKWLGEKICGCHGRKILEGLKSLADMKILGRASGGSITCTFLKQFVKETPWAHIDIAGPVWTDKENGYNNAGAIQVTGFAVNWVISGSWCI